MRPVAKDFYSGPSDPMASGHGLKVRLKESAATVEFEPRGP